MGKIVNKTTILGISMLFVFGFAFIVAPVIGVAANTDSAPVLTARQGWEQLPKSWTFWDILLSVLI
jgi:hypothetical protein